MISGSGRRAATCVSGATEIVRRAEALLSRADVIQTQVANAAVATDKLVQSILAKAFRGDLVSTEVELARRKLSGSREVCYGELAFDLIDRTRWRGSALKVPIGKGEVNMTDMEVKVFPIETLREFSTHVFLHFGVPEKDAMQAADVLACADLRGIDSHGVARLHSYFDMLSLGRINPKPEIKVVRSTSSTATVDGDNGLGLVVGPQANRIAMDMAEKSGSGWMDG